MEQNLSKIDVLTLLPQRRPFVMIDALTHFDAVVTTTVFTVREDNIFLEDGELNPCAIVENIAQTCAARMGYINGYLNKESVKLGFIGSVKNLNVFRTPLLGDTLTTSIKVMEEVMQLTLVEAEVKIGEKTVATAEMKIALSDIDAQS